MIAGMPRHDDEVLIRMAVIDALEDAGFVVIEAGTANEALDIIEKQTIHFLFTDIQMPGQHSGIDLAHEVATRFPRPESIIASRRVRPDDQAAALGEVLTKAV
ncbi:response regulator transcription factor [Pararhizobium sp. DWP3-4]|uniref:response regulator transcription factor n=1 Tax=Pararhizobium sp. DWP3-4 TaxID=2804565 RepID=UPI003CEB0401